ncbi:acyl carrier protein [Streptomyces sp. NPDC048506]|uniref:acyl carrier protein n=1 Tax=Streptomyces sp. NPDC048506 TaxID=3155028 RepID=UPI00343BDCF6
MNAAEVVNALLVQRFGVPSGVITDEPPLRGPRGDSPAREGLRFRAADRPGASPKGVPPTARGTAGRLVAAVDGLVTA